MTQAIPVQDIQEAGGLEKWIRRQGATVAKNATTQTARPVPSARGRNPQDLLVGYDGERMNKLEAKYAAHLEELRRAGGIVLWKFEAIKFRLADRTWYSPDFYIMRPDGCIEIHEAKGFWEDDARVKIKATAEQFPEFWFVAVQWKDGEWQTERFRAVKAAA